MGMLIADLIAKLGLQSKRSIGEKKQYACLESDQVREFKQIQEENMHLKKLVAELSLDKAAL